MSLRAFAAHLGVAVASVTNWERRGHRIRLRDETQQILDRDLSRADEHVRQRFEAALSAATPATPTRLQTQGTATPLANLGGFSPVEPTPVPRKVGRKEIAQVRLAADLFTSWDNAHGGGLAREAVFAQLSWCAKLLHVDSPEPVRRDLFAAVAELGGIAGFMAFDAYAHTDARRAFEFSLQCAEESRNWHVRASILSMRARQAIWCGNPDDGLIYVEKALVRSDQLTATERASLHTLRARALAKMRRHHETLTAVGVADEAFAHAKPADDPPWMAFYDHAQHHGDTGHALWDLSVRGRRTEAAPRLAYSVAHHTPEYGRSRTMSRIKLASLTMITGDPRKAAAVGHKALDDIADLRSRRAIDDVRELRRLAGRHRTMTEVENLRDRITEVLDDQ
ncbi:hypothetical protein RB614_31730 [Phytohabitans sp. ZYX-F-186]|uniref:Uncharacterized protein n=1 Tax=Phytohabitans maris TaxID=3071409 RepID=A0ABU0ZPZ2_9ACTN|nr:hypothetical protein [Phytohabitans sp. ZYX-F-186]MDQ7909103.1 hypothetical protein [Phytohabitans sp. ZYX-F-186]